MAGSKGTASDILRLSPFHDCVNRACVNRKTCFGRKEVLVLTFVSRFEYSRSRVQRRLTSPDGRRVHPSSSGHHQNGGARNRGSRFDDSRALEVTVPVMCNGFDVLAGKPSQSSSPSLDNGLTAATMIHAWCSVHTPRCNTRNCRSEGELSSSVPRWHKVAAVERKEGQAAASRPNDLTAREGERGIRFLVCVRVWRTRGGLCEPCGVLRGRGFCGFPERILAAWWL